MPTFQKVQNDKVINKGGDFFFLKFHSTKHSFFERKLLKGPFFFFFARPNSAEYIRIKGQYKFTFQKIFSLHLDLLF